MTQRLHWIFCCVVWVCNEFLTFQFHSLPTSQSTLWTLKLLAGSRPRVIVIWSIRYIRYIRYIYIRSMYIIWFQRMLIWNEKRKVMFLIIYKICKLKVNQFEKESERDSRKSGSTIKNKWKSKLFSSLESSLRFCFLVYVHFKFSKFSVFPRIP